MNNKSHHIDREGAESGNECSRITRWKVPILDNLRKPLYLLVAVLIGLVFWVMEWMIMARLPGETDNMCVIGAELTPANLIFAAVLGSMLGIFVTGFYALYIKNKAREKMALTTVTGIGFIAGPVTTFCALCSIPAISLFGVSAVLGFFNTYNLLIKIVSLGVAIWGIVLINRQLAGSCERCRLRQKN